MCFFFPLFFSDCNTPERKLNRMWPDKHSGTSADLASVTVGFIITKSTDTLRGYIKIQTVYYYGDKLLYIPLLPFNKTKKADIIKVKLEDIDYVRVNFPQKKGTSDYMPIQSTMWLILGSKNQIRLCYQNWGDYFFGNNWDEMILISGSEISEIPISNSSIFHPRSYFILEFINKRYSEHFKQEDFKDEKAMEDYILDKENKKQFNK